MVVTVLGACVSVDATRIRKGLYVVSVRGNAIGGSGEAITAAHERANELCPDGYNIEDSASASSSSYLRTTYGVQQIRKPEVTIVVRCDQPEQPAPRPAAAAPTAAPEPGCELLTTIAPVDPLFGNLPPSLRDDEIYNALVQFLVASGTPIETQDRGTYSIVTKSFPGTSIRSRCGADRAILVEHRLYALHIVVIGSRVVIRQECREASELDGQSQPPLTWRECRGSAAAKDDAAMALNVFEGAAGLIDMKRSPPGQGAPARWWCVGGVTCWRDQGKCAGMPQADTLGCHPLSRAYCRGEMCFATLDLCSLGNNASACVYQD